MGRKLISKPQGLVSGLLKSLREFGYISVSCASVLALQLPFLKVSESMGNHDSEIVDACSVD